MVVEVDHIVLDEPDTTLRQRYPGRSIETVDAIIRLVQVEDG
jgi:hypothetical protein